MRTDDGWLLVDPHEGDSAAMDHLERLVGKPSGVVLTSDGHERDAPAFRAKWGCPIWGPIPHESERGVGYDDTPDHTYEEGGATNLPAGLRAIRLSGLWGGDHALRWQAPSGERVLFTGDPVNGQLQME